VKRYIKACRNFRQAFFFAPPGLPIGEEKRHNEIMRNKKIKMK
jgi:hypothetical protein